MPDTGTAFDPNISGQYANSQSTEYDKTLANNQIEGNYARTDLATESGRMSDKYNDVLKPQLMGSVATAGNYYSGAGQDQLGQQNIDYTNAQTDLHSSVQRHLDSLQSQNNWASVGLV
jgi:hypothetical protein